MAARSVGWDKKRWEAGPVISIVFSFGYGIQKSLLSSTCGGYLSLHVYQYEIYLENTGTNQFRN